ncbi:MAG: acyl--CoA ligase, partial [Clostridia bacterium]|nr:acyl--CoA ligase [Clostridia bacterium]
PKMFFVPDFQLKEFKNVKNIKVVYVRMTESLSGIPNLGASFADFFKGRYGYMRKNKNIIRYSCFMKKAAEAKAVFVEKGDAIGGYFNTGGTSHGNKTVVMTNESMNASILQHAFREGNLTGDRALNYMPLFTSLGMFAGVIVPFLSGAEVVLHPLFVNSQMKKLLLSKKPNYMISVPSHWEQLLHEDMTGVDLSFLKTILAGGDTFPQEQQLNDVLRACGSKARIRIGYGMTEASAIGTAPVEDTPIGSAGKISPWMDVKVIREDYTECETGEIGEICFAGPNVSLGYLKDEEGTKELLKTHEDGRVWLHTGDLGSLDEQKNIFFAERKKRMFVRFDGTKVSPHAIEQILLECEYVSTCLVLSIPDEAHAQGACPVALIVPKKGVDGMKMKPEIEKYAKQNLPEYMQLSDMAIVEEIPRTKNGKTDYFKKA